MSDRVLVTGITGFIAKHVALALLGEGYHVRGTLRSPSREEEVCGALAAHGGSVDRLSFVQADLTTEDGWAEAADGCVFVQHLASPFPMTQPRDRNALVPVAREGTLRVLEAAAGAGARRIVLTSSIAAMMYRPGRPSESPIREMDWTDVSWKDLSAYIVSKTRAEEAAWDWARRNDWLDRLVVVNPGFVLGPPLDDATATSVDLVKMILEGSYPALPPVSYPVADVRDVARLHLAAMTAPDAPGRRLLGAGDTLALKDMAAILREEFPSFAKKIPSWTLPRFMIRPLSLFDRNLLSVVPDLGVRPVAENAYVTELTGVTFRPAREALVDAARSLVEPGESNPGGPAPAGAP